MTKSHARAELDQPGLDRRRRGLAPIASRSAARQRSDGSPTGSAAASRKQVPGLGRQSVQASPKALLDPPRERHRTRKGKSAANSAGVTPRGSSNSAKGLPRVSLTI